MIKIWLLETVETAKRISRRIGLLEVFVYCGSNVLICALMDGCLGHGINVVWLRDLFIGGALGLIVFRTLFEPKLNRVRFNTALAFRMRKAIVSWRSLHVDDARSAAAYMASDCRDLVEEALEIWRLTDLPPSVLLDPDVTRTISSLTYQGMLATHFSHCYGGEYGRYAWFYRRQLQAHLP